MTGSVCLHRTPCMADLHGGGQARCLPQTASFGGRVQGLLFFDSKMMLLSALLLMTTPMLLLLEALLLLLLLSTMLLLLLLQPVASRGLSAGAKSE